jgi:molecular chaperone DnaK
VFDISCHDPFGERLLTLPDRVAITQGLAAADPPLSRSISVVAIDDQNEQTLVPMIRKGTSLPAVKERSFRTARDLDVGDEGTALNIHVLEGEAERADLNHHVGWLQINGTHVDRPLRAGTPVEVKLRVDTSRGILATAYIPLLDLTVEDVLQDKYRPAIEPELVAADLETELQRAQEVGESRPDELGKIHAAARAVERDLASAQAGDPDAADRADLALRDLKAAVDRLALETEGERAAASLAYERDAARELVAEYGDEDARTRLKSLEIEAERALGGNDSSRMREVAEKFDALYWHVVTEHPAFWVEQFITLAEATQGGSRAASAGALLDRGRQALDTQDIDTLKAVCLDLMKLLPREEQPESRLKDIGIQT